MFTGLVEKKGIVKSAVKQSSGLTLRVEAEGFNDLRIGDSVAIDGVCQTVTELGTCEFTVFVMSETLNLTTLGSLKAGESVNLERAMSAQGRFGGHFVSGHVDGIANLISTKDNVLRFEFDTKYIVKKGSVALNGVSLTVSDVGENFFEVNLIPHTLESVKLGARVNIEVDIIAKYVEKFTRESNNGQDNSPKIDENFLMEHGFV